MKARTDSVAQPRLRGLKGRQARAGRRPEARAWPTALGSRTS